MPKRKPSVVWTVFEKCVNNSNFAVCTVCKKEYTTSGNTSNLMDHIKRKHPEELIEDDDSDHDNTSESNKKLKQTFLSKKFLQYGNSQSIKKDTINRKVALMIAVDLQPYSFVEDKGFLDLMETVAPLYKVPCKKTFTQNIVPGLYKEMSQILKNTLKSVQWLSITTDIWTSINSESYCTVTAHFLFNKKLRSSVLETAELPGSHTAECIKNFITVCSYLFI